jgi:hypothetical protein
MQQSQVEDTMGLPTTATMNGSTGEAVLYFGYPSSTFFLKW